MFLSQCRVIGNPPVITVIFGILPCGSSDIEQGGEGSREVRVGRRREWQGGASGREG